MMDRVYVQYIGTYYNPRRQAGRAGGWGGATVHIFSQGSQILMHNDIVLTTFTLPNVNNNDNRATLYV